MIGETPAARRRGLGRKSSIMNSRMHRCPLCKSEKTVRHEIFESPSDCDEQFSVCDCCSCGHKYTAPIPSRQLLDRYYCSEAFLECLKNAAPSDSAGCSHESQWSLVKRFCKGGDLLDVGAGIGGFLAKAKQYGFNGRGLEQSRELVQYARSSIGLDICRGSLEHHRLPLSLSTSLPYGTFLSICPTPWKRLTD